MLAMQNPHANVNRPVHEVFEGQTVWEGWLRCSICMATQAKRAYACSHREGPNDEGGWLNSSPLSDAGP
jgi:hypothetical protein